MINDSIRLACFLGKPILRRLPAGRVRVLGWLGGGQGSEAWKQLHEPMRIFWDADLQAWIQVDLRDWGGRWHFFTGRYYDQLLPWIMRRYLRHGDTFVDVGANFGIHTLRGACLVGGRGKVVAIEPSVASRARLELHMAMNAIGNVTVVPVAVGGEEGEAVLRVDSSHLGTSTLRNDGALGGETSTVSVRTLDSIVEPTSSDARALIKIDVEGFELEAVRGAERWLHRLNTAFVVEVTPAWISAGGGDVQELFERFGANGYSAYVIRRQRKWYREIPRLERIESPSARQADYLFVRPGDKAWVNVLGGVAERPHATR